MTARRVLLCLALLIPPNLAACSHTSTTAESSTFASGNLRSGPSVVGADTGLEVVSWVTFADDQALANALAPYAENLVPLSSEQQAMWEAQGLRMISVPIADLDAISAALKTTGQSQRQWLGQAFVWTEIVSGPDMPQGRTIALDAERIRLAPGALRLLVRDWVEPVPSADANRPPAATLRVEIVPQHREDRTRAQQADPLGIVPVKMAAEENGLLFSRLYARMSVAGGNAYIIVPERPGVVWHVAEKPEANDEAPPTDAAPETAAPPAPLPTPKVGEVVRAEKGRAGAAAPNSGSSSTAKRAASAQSGPVAPMIPTVGEAMLMRGSSGEGSAARSVVILIPRVPKEFRLIER